MKRLNTPTADLRFQGQLRHYHRATPSTTTWDQWVDSKEASSRRRTLMGVVTLVIGLASAAGVLLAIRIAGF